MKKVTNIFIFFTAILLCNIAQGMKRSLPHLLIAAEEAQIVEEYNARNPEMLNLLKEMDRFQKRAKKNELFTHQCKQCRYCPKRKRDLIRHNALHEMLQENPHEKVYRCKDCDYLTLENKRLKEHHLTHNSEEQYFCLIKGCKAKMKYLSSLNRHMEQQHSHINVLT